MSFYKKIKESPFPVPTVDIIINRDDWVVLVKRKNPPPGWALPGGFIDRGESAEEAALREAKEETSLDIKNLKLLGVYSAPERDPRFHAISVVFTADGEGELKGQSDASKAGLFNLKNLPEDMAFDHRKILEDFFIKERVKKRKKR